MNKRGLRAFSMGILLSVGILGSNYFFFEKKADQPMSEQAAKSLLQKDGYTIIPADDYKKLKQAAQKNTSSAKQEKAGAGKKQIENKVTTYQLQVTSGMSSGEIAKTLADNHIIENEKEFAQYLIVHKYQTRIQLGTYTLTNSMDYAQLAKIITKTQ